MQLFYAWFYVSRKEAGNIDHDSRATIAAVELFRILPVVAGAAALLEIHFHEALCHELHHLAQNITPYRSIN